MQYSLQHARDNVGTFDTRGGAHKSLPAGAEQSKHPPPTDRLDNDNARRLHSLGIVSLHSQYCVKNSRIKYPQTALSLGGILKRRTERECALVFFAF